MIGTHRIIVADVMDGLAQLEDQSVQCCVTSPPYWGLRDYGTEGQIGLEPTPEAFVGRMVEVFREVRRVLRDDGTLWLNLGDSYAAQRSGTAMPAETLAGGIGGIEQNGRGNRGRGSDYGSDGVDGAPRGKAGGGSAHRNAAAIGLKHKDLCGIPWRVAFALKADGWYLRSDIIWAKPNPMPESVTDRPTKAHEYLFLLTKSARYYWDAEAVREPVKPNRGLNMRGPKCGADRVHGTQDQTVKQYGEIKGANCRTVWTIPTQPYPEAHFATFPEALPERCVKAGTASGDTVLDPFCGSGTTGSVACQLGRDFVGIELNPEYAALAEDRIGKACRPSTYRSDRVAVEGGLFNG